MVSLQIVIVSLKQSTMFIRYVCKEKRLFCFNKIEWYRNSFEFQDFHLLIGPTLPFITIPGITILWVLIDYTLLDVTFAWLLGTLNSPLKKRILHAKQREWIIFILQSILKTVVFLHTTLPKLFSRLLKQHHLEEWKEWLLKIAFNPRLQSFWGDWSVREVIKQTTSIKYCGR